MIVQTVNGNSVDLVGNMVDDKTRCTHYHSELDIIAIKLKCCEKYFPCYQCHQELYSHAIEKYNINGSELVILCGNCKLEMSFEQYKSLECVNCGGKFNPGCKLHYNIYFDSSEISTS